MWKVKRLGFIIYVVLTWARVVCLIFTLEARGLRVYQVHHKCPCYNYYVSLSYRVQTHIHNKIIILVKH